MTIQDAGETVILVVYALEQLAEKVNASPQRNSYCAPIYRNYTLHISITTSLNQEF